MKYYAVIDTNVIVSAMLKSNSTPAQVLREVICGDISLLVNEEIIEEYFEVLSRTKFHFPENTVKSLIDELKNRAIFIDASDTDEYIPDPDDAVFYEVVMEVKKQTDAYLVTGNLKHFPEKPFIVTPREMMEIINNNR